MKTTNEEIKEFLQWLRAEKENVIKSGKTIGLNTDMLEQHYDKIITQYKNTVHCHAMLDQFALSHQAKERHN